MRHLSYAAMLAVVLGGTLPLHRVFRLDLARQLRRVAVSILPVAVVFVVWDVAATRAGHWAFDPGQTLSVRVLALPLEELAFFLVIPLAGLLTYEAVGVVLSQRQGRHGRRDTRAGPDGGARGDRRAGRAGTGRPGRPG